MPVNSRESGWKPVGGRNTAFREGIGWPADKRASHALPRLTSGTAREADLASFVWATPRKAFEYYLDSAGRTPADLWRAVHEGHIRVSINDVEFSGDQVRALLKLIHSNVPESEREFELPIWMAVSMDDVERALCGKALPERRRGRPKQTRDQSNRDYRLAVEVSELLGTHRANSVADAARRLIDAGSVDGASDDAKLKKVQRAYAKHFRHD